METVVLTIHLILALLLIGVVLLQKSEGAALLSGGGNTQARAKPTAITKVTWLLATAFIITSVTLTVLATRGSGSGSVIEGGVAPSSETGAPPSLDSMMPPPAAPAADAAGAPPRAEDPAAPPAAEEAPAETAPAAPAN